MKSPSYTDFLKENEYDPCQVEYFGEKKYRQFLKFQLLFIKREPIGLVGKNTLKKINYLSYTKFNQEHEMNLCNFLRK